MRHSLFLANIIALIVPAALLAGAYGFQYLGGLPPCEMCWWQRWAHMAALVPALGAMLVADRRTAVWLILLAGLAIATSGLIGVYHAGVEQHWWQGVTACTAQPISGTAAEILADVMATPLVRCDAIPWSLFGISMAGWNAIFSLGAAGTVLWLAKRKN